VLTLRDFSLFSARQNLVSYRKFVFLVLPLSSYLSRCNCSDLIMEHTQSNHTHLVQCGIFGKVGSLWFECRDIYEKKISQNLIITVSSMDRTSFWKCFWIIITFLQAGLTWMDTVAHKVDEGSWKCLSSTDDMRWKKYSVLYSVAVWPNIFLPSGKEYFPRST
jgi:hypothetical protein